MEGVQIRTTVMHDKELKCLLVVTVKIIYFSVSEAT